MRVVECLDGGDGRTFKDYQARRVLHLLETMGLVNLAELRAWLRTEEQASRRALTQIPVAISREDARDLMIPAGPRGGRLPGCGKLPPRPKHD